PIAALAVLPTLSLIVALIVVVEQRGQRGIGLEEHRAAVTTVAAVGPAARDELFSAERDAARAPVAALDEDVDLIDEHLRARVSTFGRAGQRTPPARSGRAGDDADVPVVAAALEPYVAVDLREQRVVGAEPDVQPGMKACAALPDEDAATGDELAAEALDAEHLRIRIAAVAGAADAFFVGHASDLDVRDTHAGGRLPVAALPPLVLPALELPDPDLAAAPLGDDFAGHARFRQPVGARDDLAVLVHEQHGAELDLSPLVARETLDGNNLPCRHAILLTARRDHGFH